jgi:hypothetical protein
MRIEPDNAPPPAQPQPAKEGPATRREASVPRGRSKDWARNPEKDPIDYDDGAWM